MQLLRKITLPISLIYAVVVYLRNFFYDIGWFPSKTYKTPTICVGNLSVGGTGKTPMIELLISILEDSYKIAVLSRGYRRKTDGFVLATPSSTAEELGDEPLQIYTKFPEITLVVDADRQNGISVLEETIKPDLILLDDAYQHRKVKPTFSILLTAYNNPYYNDWYLPTGNLRDSRREARRADIIVVTKCPRDLNQAQQSKIVKKLNPKPHQKVLFAYYEYDRQLKGFKNGLSLADLKDGKVTLVTGIADPKPLLDFLTAEGITFEHMQFRDHHYFAEREIDLFNTKPYILTTEKDYMRSKGKVKNLYYISVEHRFLGDGQKTLEDLLTDL